MKTFWVDYSASIKVNAENADEAERLAYEMIIGEYVEVDTIEEVNN